MAEWYRAHAADIMRDREVSDDVDRERLKLLGAAIKELTERLGRETWLIPDGARERIERLQRDLDDHPPDVMWSDVILAGRSIVEAAIGDLRELVRADLHVT